MIVFYYYRDNKNKKESLANNDKKNKINDIPEILDNIDIYVYEEKIKNYNKMLINNYLFQNIHNNFLNYY